MYVRKTNHGEAVADPKAAPATWTARHVDGLTVHGDHVGRDVADDAAADERRDLVAGDRHHRQRGGRRQPERLVVATGVVADVVEVAEDERHRAEPLQARPGRPCVTTLALMYTYGGSIVISSFLSMPAVLAAMIRASENKVIVDTRLRPRCAIPPNPRFAADKLPLPLRGSSPHITHCSSVQAHSSSRTASRSVQPFLDGS